mgnify:CR=1 FL=1
MRLFALTSRSVGNGTVDRAEYIPNTGADKAHCRDYDNSEQGEYDGILN